MFQYLDFTV